MTTDALGTAGGVVSGVDHRLANGGLVTPTGPTALDARTGVLVGPGSTSILSGTAATGTMTVAVAVFHAVTARNNAGGVYLGPNQEAATTVNIAAAPASNSRIDVVYVKQGDSDATVLTPDGSTAPILGVVTGTAAATPVKQPIPVGALELGTVTVAAGATSSNDSHVTIANTVAQVSARGARLVLRNATEESALTQYAGLEVYRIDLGMVRISNGGVFQTLYNPFASTYIPTFSYNAGGGASTPLTTTPTAPPSAAALSLPSGTFDVDWRGFFSLSVAASVVISLYLYNGSTQLASTSFAVANTGVTTSRAHVDFTRLTLASAATLTIRAATSATGGTQAIVSNAIRAIQVA